MTPLWCMPGTFSWLHKHPLMKQVSSGTRWQSQILDKTPCTYLCAIWRKSFRLVPLGKRLFVIIIKNINMNKKHNIKHFSPGILLFIIVFMMLVSCEKENKPEMSDAIILVKNKWIPAYNLVSAEEFLAMYNDSTNHATCKDRELNLLKDYTIELDFVIDNSFTIRKEGKAIETGRWKLEQDTLYITEVEVTGRPTFFYSYYSLSEQNNISLQNNITDVHNDLLEYYEDENDTATLDIEDNRVENYNNFIYKVIKWEILKCTESELILQHHCQKLYYFAK
jgi:hypothetical protein